MTCKILPISESPNTGGVEYWFSEGVLQVGEWCASSQVDSKPDLYLQRKAEAKVFSAAHITLSALEALLHATISDDATELDKRRAIADARIAIEHSRGDL